jgi:antitoxin component of MazEF toxin-antitoxin module
MTIATIGRWGGNLAIRLPKDFAQRAQFREGDQVELDEVDGEIILRKRQPPVDLDALFAERSPEEWRALYRDAFDWGEDVGREQVPE